MSSWPRPVPDPRLHVLAELRPGELLIHEIYASIQGESTFAGLPCTFVRLTGCNLRCHWCDTPHAFVEGEPMSLDEVKKRVTLLSPYLVEITGGEPLAQPAVFELIRELADQGMTVLIESAGNFSIEPVDSRAIVILDIKCPGSGEEKSFYEPNLSMLRPRDELKFVISDRTDFDCSVEKVRAHDLCRWPVLFSPVFGKLPYETLCNWILETGLPIRFQLQQHKHIWDPKARGV